jgi:hypothetical protein
VTEPDECLAAEVRDEQGQLARVERAGQALAEDVDSGDGRGVLNGREKRPRSSLADGWFGIGAAYGRRPEITAGRRPNPKKPE